MKKSAFLYTFFAAVALLFFMNSCEKENGIQPVKPQIPSQPQNDHSIVKVDNNGNLLSMPLPFVKFGSTKEEVDAWEKERNSKFEGEADANGVLTYTYRADDANKYNTLRKYDFKENALKLCLAYFKYDLFYDGPQAKSLKANVADMLKKEGYQEIMYAGDKYYSNAHVAFTIKALSLKDVLVLYIPSIQNDSQKDFVPIVTYNDDLELAAFPYPYVDFKTKGAEPMLQWEKEHGSTLLKQTQKETTETYIYRTNDPSKVNENRLYNFAENGKGRLINATATFSIDLMLNEDGTPNDRVVQLLTNDGFKKVDALSTGKVTAYMNDNFIISITSDSKFSYTIVIYAPAKPEKDEPQKTDSYYTDVLPICKWGESFAENGPIWNAEVARGRECKYEEDLEYGNFMQATRPIRAPKIALNASTIYYYDDYDKLGADCHTLRSAVVILPKDLNIAGDEVKEFIEKTGFTAVEDEENTYENSSLNVRVEFYLNFQDTPEMSVTPIKDPVTQRFIATKMQQKTRLQHAAQLKKHNKDK